MEHSIIRDINLFEERHYYYALPPEISSDQGILVARIDESLHFTNIRQLKELLQKIEQRGRTPLKAIIVDASNIPEVDANALQILIEIVEQWKRKSVLVCFVKLRPTINMFFIRSGLMDSIGYDRIFQQRSEALKYVLDHLGIASEWLPRSGDD